MRKKLSKLVAGAITAVTLAVPVATFGNIGQAPTAAYAAGVNDKIDLGKYWGIEYLVRTFKNLLCDDRGLLSHEKFEKNKDEFKRFWDTCTRDDRKLFVEYLSYIHWDVDGKTGKPTFDEYLNHTDLILLLADRKLINREDPDELAKYYDMYDKIPDSGITPPRPLPPV